MNLTPSQVVEALSQHIIGQVEAKKAIAVALRNRWRRMRLTPEQQAEVIPKNILMVSAFGFQLRAHDWVYTQCFWCSHFPPPAVRS